MTRLAIHGIVALVAAMIAAATAVDSASGSELLSTVIAAAAGAGLISILSPPGRGLVEAFVLRALAAFNPAILSAAGLGWNASAVAAAGALLWSGVFRLASAPAERSTVAAALAVAAAPFLSLHAMLFYPALFAAAPMLSPWGGGGRRRAAFTFVLFAPAAMVAAGLAYLIWLFRPAAVGAGDLGVVFSAPSTSMWLAACAAAPGPFLAAIFARREAVAFIAAGIGAIAIAPTFGATSALLAALFAGANVGLAAAAAAGPEALDDAVRGVADIARRALNP